MSELKQERLKCTMFERTVAGVAGDAEAYPELYKKVDYLLGIMQQENFVSSQYKKGFGSLILFNVLAHLYIQGINSDFVLFGFKLSEIPSPGSGLCFILGMALFWFIITTLNLTLLARIRITLITKIVPTDMPNIATAHINGGNIWTDIISPKFIGYASSNNHHRFSWLIVLLLNLYILSIFVATIVTLISLYIFSYNSYDNTWSLIISSVGLIMGMISFISYFIIMFIKFTFEIPNNTSNQSVNKSFLGNLFENKKLNK